MTQEAPESSSQALERYLTFQLAALSLDIQADDVSCVSAKLDRLS